MRVVLYKSNPVLLSAAILLFGVLLGAISYYVVEVPFVWVLVFFVLAPLIFSVFVLVHGGIATRRVIYDVDRKFIIGTSGEMETYEFSIDSIDSITVNTSAVGASAMVVQVRFINGDSAIELPFSSFPFSSVDQLVQVVLKRVGANQ